MKKMQKVTGLILFCLVALGFGSCTETEYILPPEVQIQTPESGLAIALGESIDISADVTNAPEGATYQWSVNGIKVSTDPVLHFVGEEPGNNSVKLTVTTDRGSASDAVNVLVARDEVEVAISVLGDRALEIEYLDSLILRGNVFCRDDYEVEWIIDNERVSKENYYCFKALKEGTHTITFKALDINGRFASDDVDIVVSVPALDAVITTPIYGSRTPVGVPITLHGDANRIGDISYEWIVNGETVGTDQDYTLPATSIDLVDVTLKVTDPTQTAEKTITVDVHDTLKYGTLLFETSDIHIIDYTGRVTQGVFLKANPDAQNAIDANDETKIVKFSNIVLKNDGMIYTLSSNDFVWNDELDDFVYTVRWSVIDEKTLIHQRDFIVDFPSVNQGTKLYPAFYNGKLYSILYFKTDKGEQISGIFNIDTNTGEMVKMMDLDDKYSYNYLLVYNNNFYAFNGHQIYQIDPKTWTVINTADQREGTQNLSDISKWNQIDNLLYKCGSTKGYSVFDLNTLKYTDDDLIRKSGRAGLTLTYPYNGYLYAFEGYFLGRVDLATNELTYLSDLNADGSIYYDSYNTPRTMFISKDGIMIILSYSAIGSYTRVYAFDLNNSAELVASFYNTGKQVYSPMDIN